MKISAFHAKYYAHELTRRHASDDLGKLTASLQDAKVDLNPHQVEAALFAFKSPLSKGAILADEVGLGKTIEAGIILSQKWAERKRRLLIIAPANLRKQWSQELSDKFYLDSSILEAKSFNQSIKDGNLNPFNRSEIVICSYQFARAKAPYLKATQWDMAIIDEAHRLRNVYRPDNKIGKAIKEALLHSHKVLLTATPLQNSLLELYGLVSIVDEFAFGDVKSFKSQYLKLQDSEGFEELRARLAPLCKRTLRKQVLEYISYTNRRAMVEEFYPYPEEQQLYEEVSDYLMSERLYALPSSQRHLMTMVLRKLLGSSTFAIQGTFYALAAKLETLSTAEEIKTPAEIEFGYELYEELAEEWEEDEEGDEREVVEQRPLTEAEKAEMKEEMERLKRFAALAEKIQKNAKGDKLMTALIKGFDKLKELGAAQKAIIFTESTRTQLYLKGILESNGHRDQVVLFNGTNNDPHSKVIYQTWQTRHRGTDRISGSATADKRQAIVDFFREEATIMIATEAAAEGINLQFCSLIVNYDMPWNPQRIEQRIGRCHRYGQKFDVVVINFLNKANATDVRVYQLLDQKFKLFSGVFGASDEVLGAIESGVDFEKRIARIYQECRTSEQIKVAFDLLDQQFEHEKREKLDHTKLQLLENFDDEVNQKLRVNLERGKVYMNQFEQWLWNVTQYYLIDKAQFDEKQDSFVLHTNPFPGEHIHEGPYKLLRAYGEQKRSEVEMQNDTNVYRVGHPLAQRIIGACKSLDLPASLLVFNYSNTPKKISLLEPLVGKSGWMRVTLLTISSFEDEEHLLISGCTEDGEPLEAELCSKFFSVNGQELERVNVPLEIEALLDTREEQERQRATDENMQRNAKFFDEEYGKLDQWADDKKHSLEREIKDMDADIKLKKGEAKKITDLKQKVAAQRTIKELEKKRDEKRKSLFEAQDDIDQKKDVLLNVIESRLAQRMAKERLFQIQWKLI